MSLIPGQQTLAPRPDSKDAPQNGYRSYQPEAVYAGDQNFSSDRVGHEVMPVQSMIARANGGSQNMNQEMGGDGNYQSDVK